jgi:CheY-like chemotaxis protein
VYGCARIHMPKVALVVDDSMLMRYSVCRFLEERGFAVESATNGSEALDILKRTNADLIVTDLNMPHMSGDELITVLKSKPETAGVPIVIITSNRNDRSDAGKRADFAVYKDIDIEAQLAKALDALAQKTAHRQANGK